MASAPSNSVRTLGVSEWQFVILAGGLGTRLYPLTEKIPKPIVDVAGHPYLEWQLKELRDHGAKKVLLLTGHLGEQIEAVFGDGKSLGLEISYSKETSPLGTGGAIQLALSKLEDQFVLLNGDSFLPMNFLEFVSSPARNFPAAIAAFTNTPATPVPNNLRLEGNRVVDYKKNGGIQNGYTHVDAGVYLLKRRLFSGSTPTPPFALESLWPALIQENALGVHSVTQRFYDIGTPERLKEFEEFVQGR